MRGGGRFEWLIQAAVVATPIEGHNKGVLKKLIHIKNQMRQEQHTIRWGYQPQIISNNPISSYLSIPHRPPHPPPSNIPPSAPYHEQDRQQKDGNDDYRFPYMRASSHWRSGGGDLGSCCFGGHGASGGGHGFGSGSSSGTGDCSGEGGAAGGCCHCCK